MPLQMDKAAQTKGRHGPRTCGGIVVSAVALLSVAASVGWALNGSGNPATAQSGQRVAATEPGATGGSLMSLRSRPGVLSAPHIERMVFRPGQPTEIEGNASVGDRVGLLRAGERLGEAATRSDGTWRLSIDDRLGVGDHRLQVVAVRTGYAALPGDLVRVSIPAGLRDTVVVSLAREVGAEYSQPAWAQSIKVQTVVDGQVIGADAGVTVQRVAQAQQPPQGTDAIVGAVRDWLQKADKSYQDIVVKRLSTGEAPASPTPAAPTAPAPSATKPAAPSTVVAQQAPAAPQPGSGTTEAGGSFVDGVVGWLKRANDSYQNTIVKRLSEGAIDPKIAEAQRKADEEKRAAASKAGDEALQKAREERDAMLKAAEAAKKAQDTAVAKAPAAGMDATTAAADAAARKAAEDKRIADETLKRQADLKLAEEAKLAEQKKAAEAVAARKAAEDQRLADDVARKAAEDKQAALARQAADAKKAADTAAATKLAEDKRLADEAQRKAAELAAAEQKRAADLKAAEDKRVAEARKVAEDAAARKAADDKRLAEEAQRKAAELAAAEQKRADEAKRAADQKAAEEKRLADAKKAADDALAARKAAEEKRLADEAQRKALQAKAAEEKRQADAARQAAAAEQKAAAEIKRRAAELAEAASRVQIPTTPPTATPPKSQSPSMPAAPSTSRDKVADGGRPAAATKPSFDSRERSTLGAGHQAAAVRNRATGAKDAERCRQAGRRIKPPGYYVVKEGDSLWEISELHYRDGAHFERIERANRKLGDPDVIRPCQKIFIPAARKG